MIMRVLIADKFEESGRIGLRSIGCEISFKPDLKDEALVEAVGKEQPDVLIVRGTKVTEPMLAAGPLKLVVRAGAGYNTIDVAVASRDLRGELSGQEFDCGRGTGFCLDSRFRSTHCRQRDCFARRRVEQEGVFESP